MEGGSWENPRIEEVSYGVGKSNKPEVSVVIPAYYLEGEYLKKVVEAVREQLADIFVLKRDWNTEIQKPIDREIILVVNWAEDNEDIAWKVAREILEEFRKEQDSGSVWSQTIDPPVGKGVLKVGRYPERFGKMAAMQKSELARWENVVFVDADLKIPSDRPFLLRELLNPLLKREKIMTIAALMDNPGNWPLLARRTSGQRALPRDVALKAMEWLEENWFGGYGVEIGLTMIISKCFGKDAIKVVQWPGVGQIQKMQKMGVGVGLKGYMRMHKQMITTRFKLRKILSDNQKVNELCARLRIEKK